MGVGGCVFLFVCLSGALGAGFVGGGVCTMLVRRKNWLHFSICACHPCAGAMLIFSVSFQFSRMITEGNPSTVL